MSARPPIVFARETDLPVSDFRRVLDESGLGTTRPVDDEPRMKVMLAEANLIMTAREAGAGGAIVGVARCLTDFAWCCYVAELAVSSTVQGLGIGRQLLEEVRRELGPQVSVILISMPDAVGFYERIGMTPVPNTFWFRRDQ